MALAAARRGESHPIVGVFSAADLVEAAVRTGREAEARGALARLAAWAAHPGSGWGRALVARCHGLLAGHQRDRASASQARSVSSPRKRCR